MIQVLLNGVLPIFAIAVAGYLLGMRGVFSAPDAAIINRLVFMLALPALGLGLLLNAPFADFNWPLLVIYFLCELFIYFAAIAFARKILNCELKESILLGLAAAFGNHVLFVLPIAIGLFGDQVTAPIIAIVTLDSILLFGGSIVLMEALTTRELTTTRLVKQIAKNPPLVALIVGVALAPWAFDIPRGLNLFLKFAGDVAAPCALFSLGIVLSQTRITDRVSAAAAISAFKLIGLPAVVGFMLIAVFGYSTAEAKVALMVAAAPCGAMAFVLALNYDVRTDAIASAILFTMLGSLVSVTLMAAL